jgi:hypothetical protein
VLAQNYKNFETCNNQSTDGSREIATRLRTCASALFDNPAFVGQTENYNGAFKRVAADAKYVKMVQADDAICPDSLRLMVAVGEQNPRIGLVSSYYLGRRSSHSPMMTAGYRPTGSSRSLPSSSDNKMLPWCLGRSRFPKS